MLTHTFVQHHVSYVAHTHIHTHCIDLKPGEYKGNVEVVERAHTHTHTHTHTNCIDLKPGEYNGNVEVFEHSRVLWPRLPFLLRASAGSRDQTHTHTHTHGPQRAPGTRYQSSTQVTSGHTSTP